MKILASYCFLLAGCLSLSAADYQAGVVRALITPPLPAWLSGYAARTNSARDVLHDLWAKALALEDSRGRKAVIVTMDLIGLPREVSAKVASRVQTQYGLDRSRLLLNTSHTHSGPAVFPNLSVMFTLSPEDARQSAVYAEQLTDQLVAVVGAALRNLAPAKLSRGQGSVGFAVNRRQPVSDGYRIGVNTNGPVDHTVPVLKITDLDNRLRAVVFGYACHNTTLGGDRYQINGDYAGFAQLEIEAMRPGATAMFLILCGADQNPSPRGTVELATRHGQSLAQEVVRVMDGPLEPVSSPLRAAYQEVKLEFAEHTLETFAQEVKSTDRFKSRRASLMLRRYEEGHPVRSLTYPVQAVRLGDDLAFLALGGEVVVDYAIRAKREFPRENLVVSGYCNEVMSYIPSKRVLEEGGYEPVTSMIYYGQPGPFRDDIEDRVFAGINRVMRRVGARR